MEAQSVTFRECHGWLPAGKRAAVCFNIDDVHPATSRDEFEAGGELGNGALGNVERLLARHPQLRVTLFVTPDWRLRRLVPSRGFLTRMPVLRERIHWAPVTPRGRFRVDRFPEFVAYLNAMPRTECAVHGLHHAHQGPRMAMEFQRQTRDECGAMLQLAREIFRKAGLRHVRGFAAPAWNTPPALCEALREAGFHFVTSARDLDTPIRIDARAAGAGLRGAPLLRPTWVRGIVGDEAGAADARGGLVHFPTNFQATSAVDRARAIIEDGGLLSIKAHIFKCGGGLTMLDGLDADYCDYLDELWSQLARSYGESLWWTTLAEIAARCQGAAQWKC
ncbi:MAG: DUF2334 domain-containing protein [Gammaproteobacteria bacterium]|nr:DUF2334 domain-containing protein [Gammaproteobacteria bacterium]